MKPSFLVLLLITATVCFISCKKDSSDTPNNQSIVGNYKFVSLTASTISTQIVSDGVTEDKSVTYSNYTTKNNTGTLVIDDKNITSTDLSYSVDTIAKAYFYEDNILIDSTESNFHIDIPASSATSGYTLVSTDSIYMISGSMFFNGSTSSTGPAGVRYKVEGDKLYIYGGNSKTTQQNQSGYIVNQKAEATVIITYQKQ
ncbi:MAG: hypothetical protein JST09_17105 [Bacteroidetes bacterium]|nr:hypothetical protein [Bacteroidota bacterium]